MSFFEKNTKKFAYILIALAIIVGFLTRIAFVNSYVEFEFDQARDGYEIMRIWEGQYPGLGPVAGGYEYHLPPLYYYLVFPFTVFGPSPVLQVLPNAIFSFLSIPLLIIFAKKFFEKLVENEKLKSAHLFEIKPDQILLYGSIAGFWWSVFTFDILLSNRSWNPNSIPFFFLSFLLLVDFQINSKQKYGFKYTLSWILFGIISAILVSLHSATLVIIPILVVIIFVYFLYKNREIKFLIYPLLSILTGIITLAPYWKFEIANNFSNTLLIITKLLNGGGVEQFSFLEKISRPFEIYNYLWGRGYLVYAKLNFLGYILGIGSTIYFALKTKLNLIPTLLITTISIFLIGSLGYTEPTIYQHYLATLWFIPILFVLGILILNNQNPKTGNRYALLNKFISCFLIGIIVISIFGNIHYSYNYITRKVGPERLINTNDIEKALNQIPEKSIICIDNFDWWVGSYRYFETYITKKEQIFVEDCSSAQYYFFPKFEPLRGGNYTTIESTPTFTNTKIYIEESSYIIFSRNNL